MDTKIELNKDRADAARYYQLFRDKTGEFKDGEKILLLHIGNFDVLDRFIKSNEKCEYTIIDQFLNGPWFELSWPNAKVVGTSEDESIVKALMVMKKFDKIIMNPPYFKNLHLKILEEAIKHLNEDGKCVNLSPIRWLQDPLAKYKKNSDYKKFENNISKHIESLDVIATEQANRLFNIMLLQPLGLYSINADEELNLYKDFNTTSLLDKIFFKIIEDSGYSKMTTCLFNDKLKNFVIQNNMAPPMKYGRPMFDAIKTWCGYFANGKNEKGETYREAKKNCKASVIGDIEKDKCIIFNSELEVKNCYNAFRTIFSRFVCMKSVVDVHVHQQFLPWMGDVINPRTGKKGYESEWTDEDFYKYFGITEDEQKLIEETMECYK